MSRWARTVGLEVRRGMWELQLKKNLNGRFLTILIHGSCSVSPQRSVSLNLDDVQGVEVGDEQVGLSVGCTGGENKHLDRCHNKVAA